MSQTETNITKSTSDAEFKELIDRYCEAWTTKDGKVDWEVIGQLYAKDADLVFYDAPLPKTFVGYEALKAAGMELFENLASMKLTPSDDVRVFRRRDVVWTTATIPLRAVLKSGNTMEFNMRQTAIWEKRGDEWQMVHEHVSAPFEG